MLDGILATLAILSVSLLLWQWFAALRFPLHRRDTSTPFTPDITVLKPLKGADDFTERCLRTWFQQDYPAELQILFGVADASDPVCPIVEALRKQHPDVNARLVICPEDLGTNAKVSKLIQLSREAEHDVWVVSDADVSAPAYLLSQLVQPLSEDGVGVVSCPYSLANPSTPAMHCEAIAINADFWSQVLQARSMKPMDFALGAVMVTRRRDLERMGGFVALADCLADDYQLGHRIVRNGHRAELATVAVECWDPPQGWAAVWAHQLRWARTIRVCQPVPYFFSILSNPTLWPLVWLVLCPGPNVAVAVGALLLLRALIAGNLQTRLTRSTAHWRWCWLAPVKDLVQAAIWGCSFLGNRVAWRGRILRLKPNGTLVPVE